MTISAHPLTWPAGWRRTSPTFRKEAKFGRASSRHGGRYEPGRSLTLTEGLERVLMELQRMGVQRQDVIVSTNVRTRLDGLPRSGEPEPRDPGVAVYWKEPIGPMRVMAIDIYDRVADNLAAVAATLEAMRSIERHGGAAILERAFTGFEALPAPAASRDWWEVLGVSRTCTREEAKEAYRRLRSEHHPDRGGSAARFDEIQKAFDTALAERFT